MCNFVLPAKKKLPGNKQNYGLFHDAGKKLYPERKAKPEIIVRKKNEVRYFLPIAHCLLPIAY